MRLWYKSKSILKQNRFQADSIPEIEIEGYNRSRWTDAAFQKFKSILTPKSNSILKSKSNAIKIERNPKPKLQLKNRKSKSQLKSKSYLKSKSEIEPES